VGMECHLATSEEFQVLRKRLLSEVKKLYKIQVLDHSPIYMRLICTKIHLIGDTLEFIYKNPQMTIHELSCRIEDKIDSEEKDIDDAQTSAEKEMILHRMLTYEWIFSVLRNVLLKYRL
jgi:hypothetical protein